MKPKSWRENVAKITLEALSKKMGGISTGYLSEIENGKKTASARVIKAYYKVSKKRVKPSDF